MPTPKLKSILGEIDAARKQLDEIIAGISVEEFARRAVEKTPQLAEHLIQEFNAAGDALAAQAWPRVPRGAADLFIDPVAVGSGNSATVDTRPLVEFFWMIAGEEIKAKFAEKVRARGPGISDEDRAARLAEHDAKIAELWNYYESIVSQVEAVGFEIERDPRIPPAIFLQWSDTDKHFNETKIEKLRRVRGVLKGEAAAYQQRADGLAVEEVAAERELVAWDNSRPAFRGEDPSRAEVQTRLEGKIHDIRERRAKLSRAWDERQRALVPARTLLARCEEFLKSKGIDVRPGTVEFMLTAAR